VTELDRETWFSGEVLPHEPVLRGYLGRFFQQPTDIDDVLQDTYARLIGLADDERSRIRSPHAFLFATARNVALDRLRRQRVISLETMTELEQLDVIDESPSAYDELNARQELALLARALATLPERCRQVLTLRKVYGLSQKEIATRLAITENTVEKQVSNGMRMCTAYLFAMTHGDAKAEKSALTPAGARENTDVE
jgi:RNA polymerase sigma factor (sigma-70 family)